MAEISKQALKVDNNQSFPNNNNGAITPSILRAFNTNMIDSMVDEISYNVDSASWNQQIDALEQFSASASGLTTGSLLVTASAAGNVITFRKGDNSTFNVTVATGSIPDISNLNQATASLQQFTASAQISINNLNTTTASLNSSVSQLNASSASQQVSINNLNTTTASLLVETQNLELFSASALVSISNLNQSSASQQISIDNLNSKTGSYATTGSNTFVGANTFTSISASSFVSASEFIGNGSKITGITASIALPILDEGIPQGNAFSMNFTGSGISAVVVGGTAVVSVNTPDSGTINNLTASFNAYTASTNAFTASSNTSASLALYTASFDNGTRNLTFTKGDTQTFSVNIPDVSGSTGNFATTGSNTFVGNQTITGSLLISGSEVIVGELTSSRLRVNSATSLGGTLSVAFDTIMRGDLTVESTTPQIKLRDNGAGGFSSGYDLRVDTGSFEIYDDTHNRNVLSDFFDSASASHTTSLTSEIIVISGSTSVTLIGNVSASIISASTINGLGNPLSFSSSVASQFASITGSSINTGSFATTGSNSFIGNQIITGNVTISGSATTDLTVVGQIYVSSSATGGTTQPRIIVSGSGGQSTIARNFINTTNGTDTAGIFPSTVFSSDVATQDEIGFTIDPSVFGISGWSTGPAIYVNNDALDTYPAVFGFQNKANYTDGRVAVLTPLSASAGFTASLQNGYAWVGNSLGQNTQVATSSFGTAINTGSFATTGSNNFVGNQTITGSLNQTGNQSISGAIAVSGNVKAWGDGNDFEFGTYSDDFLGGAFNLSTDKSFAGFTMGANQDVTIEIFANGGNYDTFKVMVDSGSNGTKFQDLPSGGVYDTWMSVATSANTSSLGEITLYRNTNINGNLDIQSTLTSSLQQGYIWVGNASGKTTTVATSSFATTGSNSFTGPQIITGSLIVTGSAFGNVVSMSITSNTASMDLSLGNYFTLTLADTATTHISASNVQPGVSATLVITTGTNSSASLAPTMLQPSGSAYSATNGSAKKDILSIVAVASGVPFVVSTKNMV